MKRIVITALAPFILLSAAAERTVFAAERPEVSARGAVLISADTGEIVFSENFSEKLPMASTTKIMTTLLCLESGDLYDEFVVDSDAIHVEGSSMGLVEGDTVTKYALCVGMLLPSGNDAANAWKKAAQLDPTYFLAYAYLAGIYDEQEKFDLALYNYRKVIETNPDYYYAYESTAILEYHFGNYDNARSLFDKAYSYAPNNYSYKLMNIAMYLKEGNRVTAKKVGEALMKTLERDSLEYSMTRLFIDNYSKNAETTLVNKINKERENDRNKYGKMLFYMGLFNEVNGSLDMAREYYAKVTGMQAPMFFEYRIAEWGLGL